MNECIADNKADRIRRTMVAVKQALLEETSVNLEDKTQSVYESC